jgi:hypothetical protein
MRSLKPVAGRRSKEPSLIYTAGNGSVRTASTSRCPRAFGAAKSQSDASPSLAAFRSLNLLVVARLPK